MTHYLRMAAASVALLLAAAPALAEVNVSGYVRSYAGVIMDIRNDYSILQTTFEPSFEYGGDKGAFKVTPYLYHYVDKPMEFGLRQAYVDLYLDKVDFRIGQQQIVWGKADGVFITDIVSPKDLSEFLLRDFDEIRMGVTSLKTDIYFGNHTLELVWIPMFTPTRLPESGSIWRPKIPMKLPVKPVWDRSREDVEFRAESGEYLGKFSAMTSIIDFELMGGYMWDDDPAIHIRKTINPATRQVSAITLAPEHHRLYLAGGSFSSTLLGFVLRGEGGYYFGKQYNTADPKATDALIEKDYVHYLVGIDKTLWGVRLSSQFIQKIIVDYDRAILNDEVDNTLTFLARTDFWRETLDLEFFVYYGLNNNDALIRSRISYDVMDGLNLLLGVDTFVGDSGRFGQYADNDMAYTKIKYSF